MKTMTKQLLKACSLSVALLGSAAVVLAVSLPDAAYANNGKGNGNGGGNGNAGGNGNSGGNGSGNGGGNSGGSSDTGRDYSKSDKASTKSSGAEKKKTAKTANTDGVESPKISTEVGGSTAGKIKPKRKDLGSDGLAHPSELGALNAAHANPNALENAAPNSRVGRIAAYRDVVLDGQRLATLLEEKSALLDTIEDPRPLSEITDALALANADVQLKSDAVTTLEAALQPPNENDPVLLEKLRVAKDALTAAQIEATELKEEEAAAIAYAALDAEVKALTKQVAEQPMLERSALEAAANKPVTDEVEATVKALLGL